MEVRKQLMQETAVKPIKIFALSKEINVIPNTILDFLKDEGFNVKTIMSPLDEEMLNAVMMHFKKDRDNKEKREKKTHEREEHKQEVLKIIEEKKIGSIKHAPAVQSEPAHMQRKRAKKETLPPPPPEIIDETPQQKEQEVSVEPVEIIPVIELPQHIEVPQEIEIEETEVIAESVEEAEEIIEEQPETILEVEDEIIELPATVAPGEPVPKKKILLSGLERVRERKRGITIVGKIELEKKKTATPAKPADKIARNIVPTDDAASKKKKKKKKVKGDKIAEQDDLATKAKKIKKVRKAEVDQEEVKKVIDRTFEEMSGGTAISSILKVSKKRKERKREEAEQKILEQTERDKSVLRVTEYVSVNELANLMKVNVAEVIQKSFKLGKMVSINQRLEKDMIELLADDFGMKIEFQKEFTAEVLEDVEDAEETLRPRPPVVTIMGHVDHGKTSLLDYIRTANVVAGEAGGITQHIGAYEVTLENGRQITFLDTPGHEAFTAMRARGAQLTDIVVLVVAADDSVMPQTLEAISHAQAANVPIVIAINKMDKPGANSERIKQQLSKKNILIEEYGGKYQSVEISAKKGMNIGLLLEKILLEAEIMNLKANPARHARGAVVEAQLDKGRGIVATVLVQKGTMRIGDPFICGNVSGRVRAMFDERGKRTESAPPSTPVQITGFDDIPQAGDEMVVVESDKVAREISNQRSQLKREQDFRQRRMITLDDISKQIKEGQVRDLNVMIKGDVDGSVEALADSLLKLSTAEVRVNVVYRAVGAITESDVLLATASSAIIIGFNVRPSLMSRRLAAKENVDIRLYNIIYNAINEVKLALEGLLAPEVKEEITATVAVRDVFKLPKGIMVAGCYVEDGTITRQTKVRLIRDGIVQFDGAIDALKRFKDDVREVAQGFECGMSLQNFNDIKAGDIIEGYKLVEVKRKL